MTTTQHNKSLRPPGPSPNGVIDKQPGRFRFDESRWWRWARTALAVLMVVVATGAWLIGQTFWVFLFAPAAVAAAAVGQRALAAVQGRLNTRFVTQPPCPSPRADPSPVACAVGWAGPAEPPAVSTLPVVPRSVRREHRESANAERNTTWTRWTVPPPKPAAWSEPVDNLA